MPRQTPARRQQHGIATVLIVVFTGFALTAAALGTAYRIRGAQEQSVALQTQTQAQIRAWTGAELLRQYLEEQSFDTFRLRLEQHFAASENQNGVPISLRHSDNTELPGIGARFTHVDANNIIWAEITGVTQEGQRSEARAVLEIGYGAVTSGGEGGGTTPGTSCTPPQAAVMFHGDVNYTGGGLDIVNTSGRMVNVAIDGKLSISSATMAGLSGCTKGDINLSGGGIAPNSTLWTEGKLTLGSISPPNNASIWAKDIELGWGSGTYGSIQAGAFTANVIDDASGATIGTTVVGGELSPPPNSMLNLGGNRIIPFSNNTIFISLENDGGVFRVPLNNASIDATSGTITPGTSVTRISGSGALPARFYLNYTGVSGGALLLKQATANTLWANNITLDGWNGTYANIRAFSNIDAYSTNITSSLRAGGNYRSLGGSPTLSSGGTYRIGGAYQGGTAPSLLQVNSSPHPVPSLPGIPYCNAESQAVNVEPLRNSANYAFYFDGNTPMLRVQNVRRQDTGASLDGTYNLAVDDLRNIGDQPFLQCGNWAGDTRCFSNATPSGGWQFLAFRFPKGVFWFDRSVTLTANSGGQPFLGSILSAGDITLGNSGGDKNVRAPNHATPAEICGTPFHPTNLCSNSGGSPAFMTWDDNGVTRTGNPIGNIALMGEGGLNSQGGWTVRGATLLGRNLTVSGATTTIHGTILVGANQATPNTISAGGLKVVIDGLSDDQLYTPGSCTPTENTGPGEETTSTVRIKWSRYL